MPRTPALIIPFLIGWLLAATVAADAQTFPSLALPTVAPLQVPSNIRIEGAYETTPVTLDGLPLFRIAVPAQRGSDAMSAQTRQQFVNAALAQLTAARSSEPNSGTVYDPASLKVEVQPAGDQAVITAKDAHHPPFPILTVTGADAKYAKVPVSTLAETWQAKLQTALVTALVKRQPAQLAENTNRIARVATILVLLSGLVLVLRGMIDRRIRKLEAQIDADTEAMERASTSKHPEESSATQRRRFLGLTIRSSAPEMTIEILHATAAILTWALLFSWYFALLWALDLYPQTTATAHFLRRRTLAIAVIVLAALVMIRVADIGVVRLAQAYGRRMRGVGGERRARLMLRVPTVASAITACTTFVIFFIAVLAILGTLNISTGSVLTLGGIVALGVTFAAQNVLRDVLNGFFVLFEDQYVVGDYVVIDQFSGIVENMTLRVVQLRDAAGNLITIPHGQVNQVVNSSRDWSRIDYRVAVDARADVAQALTVLRVQLEAFSGDSKWRADILGAVELIGVESVGANGIVLRASLKTAPLRQFELRREINARVVAALREAGIGLGIDPKVSPGVAMSVNPGAS